MRYPRRGEIYWGPGQTKTRPLLVISNDTGNRYSEEVIVIAGTGQKLDKIYPVEVKVEGYGLEKPTKFTASKIFTILQEDLGNRIGRLPNSKMAEIEKALLISLDITHI